MTDKTPRQLGIDVQHDVVNAFAGKLWTYTAVTADKGWALGVAVANERGYSPIPTFHYHSEDMDAAEAEANRLNAARGQDEATSLDIVGSSMFAQRVG